ncbi:MAG: peptidase M50 [Nitrospirae bacterium GWC2_57_9]|nr:MAG: peptidase M50 [Nitrospirae bacterium GWC2_57_9]
MFGKGITLFRILGFAVRVDLSWLILALLVTWSLAVGLFPNARLGLAVSTYWWMGLAGAAGMFVSILFHEFCHSLVARRFGMPMKGITLFIFGGVAEMDDEPPGPRAEFYMAVAGPLSSIVLGLAFYVALLALEGSKALAAVTGVLGYLAFINWVLAAFNLIPAFPLDGGRVLRAALWHWKKDLRSATRIASRLGSAFGLVIIFLGVVNILLGNVIGGLWQFMIGMFLRSAAQMSYQQVLVRRSLQGAPVARFMNPDPVTAPASINIRELVENYLYRYHFKMLPVRDNGRLIGCISTQKIKSIPRGEWDRRTVAEAMDHCSAENSVRPDTDAMKAFSLMGRTGNNRLMVVEDDRLLGIITIRDIMGYLQTSMELEENGDRHR